MAVLAVTAAVLPAALSAGCALRPTAPVPVGPSGRVAGARILPDTSRLREAALSAVATATAERIGRTARFDASRARAHAAALARIGVRRAGSSQEYRAILYARDQLRAMGYQTGVPSFTIAGGKRSHNVVAVLKGTSPRRLVLGGHVDSKSPSPGANDNASGVGVLLELARVLRHKRVRPTVVFVFFGAEEVSGPSPDQHHYGSRDFVRRLSGAGRREIAGMVSVDMVGRGRRLVARSMGRGPLTLVERLRAFARSKGVTMGFLKDLGRTGWSDHEAFELAGIPVAWIEWNPDPVYHTSRDTASRLSTDRIRTTGRLLQDWVLSLDEADLKR